MISSTSRSFRSSAPSKRSRSSRSTLPSTWPSAMVPAISACAAHLLGPDPRRTRQTGVKMPRTTKADHGHDGRKKCDDEGDGQGPQMLRPFRIPKWHRFWAGLRRRPAPMLSSRGLPKRCRFRRTTAKTGWSPSEAARIFTRLLPSKDRANQAVRNPRSVSARGSRPRSRDPQGSAACPARRPSTRFRCLKRMQTQVTNI